MPDDRFFDLGDNGNVIFQRQAIDLSYSRDANSDDMVDDRVGRRMTMDRLVFGKAKLLFHCDDRVFESKDAKAIRQTVIVRECGAETRLDGLAKKEFLF